MDWEVWWSCTVKGIELHILSLLIRLKSPLHWFSWVTWTPAQLQTHRFSCKLVCLELCWWDAPTMKDIFLNTGTCCSLEQQIIRGAHFASWNVAVSNSCCWPQLFLHVAFETQKALMNPQILKTLIKQFTVKWYWLLNGPLKKIRAEEEWKCYILLLFGLCSCLSVKL